MIQRRHFPDFGVLPKLLESHRLSEWGPLAHIWLVILNACCGKSHLAPTHSEYQNPGARWETRPSQCVCPYFILFYLKKFWELTYNVSFSGAPYVSDMHVTCEGTPLVSLIPPGTPRGSHAVSDGAPAAVLRAPVTSVTGSLYSLMPSCRLSHPFPQRPSPLAAIGLLSVSVN